MSKALIQPKNYGFEVQVGTLDPEPLIYIGIHDSENFTVAHMTKAEAMLLAKMLQNAVWEVAQNEHV